MAEIVPSEMQEQINKHYLDMSPEMMELIHAGCTKSLARPMRGSLSCRWSTGITCS